MFTRKQDFFQNKDKWAKLLRTFNLSSLKIWVYELKPEYADKLHFHHGNIGITIPKKFHKSAVVRNQIKRRIKRILLPLIKHNKKLFVWVRVNAGLRSNN